MVAQEGAAEASSRHQVPEVAGPDDVRPGLVDRLGQPGAPPYTRGVYPRMYLDQQWAIRQLAGFGSATDTNKRYRLLLEQGATAINGVFDYPSLRAFASDDPRAEPDVGRGGVAVDTLDDFQELFAHIALDETSVSLVSSQPIGAVPHLAMFLRAAEARGFAWGDLSGTSQNDFLMETAITIAPEALPPAASFRLACDLAEFTTEHLPRWNPVSVSGYNYREAGATAPLELALTIAHGQAVARELARRGVEPESFLPRLTFFLCAHNDLFREVAKMRAARRMWSTWVAEELGISDEKARRFKFHTQTSGATNVARFAHVNIARSTIQALAGVLGGTQSLHINGYDEAVTIPGEHAALTALRTQYVLYHEAGVADSVDPLAGSYLVEHLTDAIEEEAGTIVDHIDAIGGLIAATESGWVHGELATGALEYQMAIESGDRKVVGVNLLEDGPDEPTEVFPLPVDSLERQHARIASALANRDERRAQVALDVLADTCSDRANVMPAALEAVDSGITLGEMGNTFREAFGPWRFPLG